MTSKEVTPLASRWALVGTRTTAERKARGRGLALLGTDATGTTWTQTHTLALSNPSYQVLNRAKTRAYTVHGDQSGVSVIDISTAGELAFLQTTDTGGRNPVHLCLSTDERFLLVTHYATGSLACWSVLADGRLGERADLLQFQGEPGPKSHHQTGSHPHQVVPWPGSDLYLVPDKGLDRLHVVRLSALGRLDLVFAYEAPAGSGPRHLETDAAHRRVWLCLELGSLVTRLGFDPATGRVLGGPVMSTLPAGHGGENSAAGIALHPSGKALYVSNRGHHSVCVLVLNGTSGQAKPLRWLDTQGRTPRFITLTPAADALIVANEDSDTVLRFPLDEEGTPGEGVVVAQTGSPVCVSLF